uniref:FF domain-containing protein n=1 Tax=Haptolina ericina TaxID=156174 RepID=A0A7S3AQX9_9EUKA
MKKIINNPSYRILASIGERKSTFHKWKEGLLEERAEAERKRQRQVKIEFVNLLKECAELTSRTRYSKVVELFAKDSRWQALDDDLEREELFEEYSLSLERKEAADRKKIRKERMADFKKLLEASNLSVRSQWRRVQSQLEDEPSFRALDKIDRLAVFEEFIRELELGQEQTKQKERDANRREERRKRDQYRALLAAKHQEGAFHSKSRWKDVVDLLLPSSEYKAACEQSGSTPAELFEDFIEQLEEQAQAHRRVLRNAVSDHKIKLTAESSIADFEAAVRASDGSGAILDGIPQSAIKAYYDELQEKIQREKVEEDRRSERRKRSLFEAFQGTLRGLMGAMLSAETAWEEVRALMVGKATAEPLTEEQQKEAFEELVQQLQPASAGVEDGEAEGGGGEGGDGEEGGEKKKKKKDKHRHKDRHRDDEDEEDEDRRKKKKRSS